MKASIIIMLLVSVALVNVPAYAQDDGDVVQLEFYFSPRLDHMQMEYGETYHFAVNVVNLNLSLEKGEVVDPSEPLFKFTGNIVLDTFFTVRREGSYKLGSESVPFNYVWERQDKSQDVPLPKVNKSSTREDSYTCDIGYGGKGVNLDEWLTFNMDVYAYLEEYRNVTGVMKYYLGDLLGEAHLKFYVISDEKRGFVNDTLRSLKTDINDIEKAIADIEDEIAEELNIDLTEYEETYSAMRLYVDDGDYVSAMTMYSNLTPTWKDEVINLLIQKAESLRSCEQMIADYSEKFSELTADYQALKGDYENFTATRLAEAEVLNAELSSVKSKSRLYLFAMVALMAGVAILAVRMFSRKS